MFPKSNLKSVCSFNNKTIQECNFVNVFEDHDFHTEISSAMFGKRSNSGISYSYQSEVVPSFFVTVSRV